MLQGIIRLHEQLDYGRRGRVAYAMPGNVPPTTGRWITDTSFDEMAELLASSNFAELTRKVSHYGYIVVRRG